jgi:hypothetical protein
LELAEKKLPYEATYIEEGENKPEWYEPFLSQTIAPQKVLFVLVSVIHQKIVKLSASSALVIWKTLWFHLRRAWWRRIW